MLLDLLGRLDVMGRVHLYHWGVLRVCVGWFEAVWLAWRSGGEFSWGE